MTLDEQILDLTHTMAAAARAGDLDRVQGLLRQRQTMLDAWLQASSLSAPVAQQLLALDADVAVALKDGIADLRRQAATLHQSARALSGYGSPARPRPNGRWLDRRA